MGECGYPGCEVPEKYILQGNDFCIFHLSIDEKDIGIGQLNQELKNYLLEKNVNCRNFIFYEPVKFEGIDSIDSVDFAYAEFHGGADFRGIKSLNSVSFAGAQFHIGTMFEGVTSLNSVSFQKTRFHKWVNFDSVEFTGEVNFRFTQFDDGVNFNGCRFVDGIYDFTFAKFKGESTDFSDAEFMRDEKNGDKNAAIFNSCQFDSKRLFFILTKFSCDKTDFSSSYFNGKEISFLKTEFSSDSVAFQHCHFSGRTHFLDNPISTCLVFSNISFDSQAWFAFVTPKFGIKSDKIPTVFFNRVQFNPFVTIFENVKVDENFKETLRSQKPLLAFRDCYLRESYFKNNDMSLFSFYGSAYFEDTFMPSCKWENDKDKLLFALPYKRRFVSREEIDFLDEKKGIIPISAVLEKEIKVKQGELMPHDYEKLSEIYLRFKTSADKAKDYNLASWFYFNEYEMKRRHIYDEKTKGCNYRFAKLLIGLTSFKAVQYYLYKLFAGYGEKPGWSMKWFGIFTALFSILHLHLGFKTPGGIPIKYKWSWDLSNTWQFICDWVHSVLFTWSNAIPYVFASFRDHKYQLLTHSGLDIGLLILNTVTLALMVIFTGIGLKRHFRRF